MSNVTDQLSSEFPDLEVPSDTTVHEKNNNQSATRSEFPDLEVPSLPTFQNNKKEDKRKKRVVIFNYTKESDLGLKNLSKDMKARYEAEGFEVRLVELNQKKRRSFASELKANEAVAKDAVKWLKDADDSVCEIMQHGAPNKAPIFSEGRNAAKALLAVGLKDNLKQMHIRYGACYGTQSKEAHLFFNHLYKAGVRNFIGDATNTTKEVFKNYDDSKLGDVRLNSDTFYVEERNKLRKELAQNIGNVEKREQINTQISALNRDKAKRGYSFSGTAVKLPEKNLVIREPSHAISKKTGLFRNVTYFLVGPSKESKMHETTDPGVLKKFFEKYRKGKSEIKVANLTSNPAPVSELISNPKYKPTTPSVATTAKRANRKEKEKIKAAPIFSRAKKKFGLKR